MQWGKPEADDGVERPAVVEKPNFGLSGALAKDTTTGNVYKGIVLKWSEPADARAPSLRWRLYVFKDDEQIALLHIHRQSAFLVGREQQIADIHVAHPSCSSQHAVIQFRLKTKTDEEGKATREVRPYIMDLESTNGTFLNGKRIEPARYYELLEKDVIKFGTSTREYVLLHERSDA